MEENSTLNNFIASLKWSEHTKVKELKHIWAVWVLSPLKAAGMKTDFHRHGAAGIEMTAFNGDPCSSRQRPSRGVDTSKIWRLTEDKQVKNDSLSLSWLSNPVRNPCTNLWHSWIWNYQHVPQRWKLWLMWLCSQGECSPSHTPPPGPPALGNQLHHSTDTQS